MLKFIHNNLIPIRKNFFFVVSNHLVGRIDLQQLENPKKSFDLYVLPHARDNFFCLPLVYRLKIFGK